MSKVTVYKGEPNNPEEKKDGKFKKFVEGIKSLLSFKKEQGEEFIAERLEQEKLETELKREKLEKARLKNLKKKLELQKEFGYSTEEDQSTIIIKAEAGRLDQENADSLGQFTREEVQQLLLEQKEQLVAMGGSIDFLEDNVDAINSEDTAHSDEDINQATITKEGEQGAGKTTSFDKLNAENLGMRDEDDIDGNMAYN